MKHPNRSRRDTGHRVEFERLERTPGDRGMNLLNSRRAAVDRAYEQVLEPADSVDISHLASGQP